MKEGPHIAGIAALIGDPARAEVLTALLADRALTATELATVAGVAKQTISAHLAKLVDAGLLAVEQQGRHRYFRLAGRDVAHLLESLMGVAFRTGALRLISSPREPSLRKARVCYDHLAGELGVMLHEGLLRQRVLVPEADGLTLTEKGRAFFARLGIDASALSRQRRSLCRACLDWSERRHHLAGALGAALLARIIELGWARRGGAARAPARGASQRRSSPGSRPAAPLASRHDPGGSRLVDFSPDGEAALRALATRGTHAR